jgi:hypothetical protein
MIFPLRTFLAAGILTVGAAAAVPAGATTIDFEGIAPADDYVAQSAFSGITFTGSPLVVSKSLGNPTLPGNSPKALSLIQRAAERRPSASSMARRWCSRRI